MSKARKVAIVTGASQGIGAALVQALISRAYLVVANSRSIRAVDNPDLVAVPGDVADPQTAERVVREALNRFGRIDTLVNNAGIFIAKPFTAYSKDDYAAYLATNVTGFFHMTQSVIETMVKQGGGHVVTMTSVPSVLASLTKGALNAATRSLAIEYAKRNVRVNAVAPGIIKTPMHQVEAHQALASLHPMGRMGEPSDVVDAVMYLETAEFVTGEILHVDGGQSAGHHTF